MCRLAASYRKEGKADSPFFEASFVAHEKSPIERKTPLSLCGRISCITPALPPCVTPPSPFPLSQYTPDPFPPYSRPFWSAALYSPMLQVSAGALAQPRMPPRGFAPLRHQKETGRAPHFGVGSPPSKGNAHAIHSIISVPQEFLPARRGKLLFPARAGLRQLGQPYPRHQAGPRSQRGATRRRPVRHPRGADVGDGPVRLSGQPLRKP